MSAFDRAFENSIGHEGGFQIDSRDKGNWTGGTVGVGTLKGTKYGISAMTYPKEDIKNLTIERAKEIYFNEWWIELSCDLIEDINPDVAIEIFDTAINVGGRRASRWLQRALNYTNRNEKDYKNITVDGVIGSGTIAALRKNQYPNALFNVMNVLQGSHYLKLYDRKEELEKYIGWINRVETK